MSITYLHTVAPITPKRMTASSSKSYEILLVHGLIEIFIHTVEPCFQLIKQSILRTHMLYLPREKIIIFFNEYRIK